MSDRLKDLQRQRALAQEQLAWLDREIARETGAATPVSPAPASSPTKSDGFVDHRAGMNAVAPAKGAQEDAEQLIEQYAQNEKPVHAQVKQGCFLYLAIAFGLVGLGVLALYLYHRQVQ